MVRQWYLYQPRCNHSRWYTSHTSSLCNFQVQGPHTHTHTPDTFAYNSALRVTVQLSPTYRCVTVPLCNSALRITVSLYHCTTQPYVSLCHCTTVQFSPTYHCVTVPLYNSAQRITVSLYHCTTQPYVSLCKPATPARPRASRYHFSKSNKHPLPVKQNTYTLSR